MASEQFSKRNVILLLLFVAGLISCTATPPTVTVTNPSGYFGGGSSSGSGSGSSSSSGGSTLPGCDSPVPSTFTAAAFLVSATQEIIPLCAGNVLYQNQVTNQIGLVNLVTQTVVNTWQLSSKPTHMVLDSNSQYLYVALSGSNNIAKMDVTSASTTVTNIPISAAARWLALTNSGVLLVNLAQPGFYSGNIDVVNTNTNSWVTTISGSFSIMMSYNPNTNELLTADWGLSPVTKRRYLFNSGANTLTLEESTMANSQGNGKYLTLSPDYLHMSVSEGGGNVSGYGLVDFSTTALTSTSGTFSVGAYPEATAFSPDSSTLLATNTTSLEIFNVATHALTETASPDLSACSLASISRVAFSQGGGLVFAYSYCGVSPTSGYMLVTRW